MTSKVKPAAMVPRAGVKAYLSGIFPVHGQSHPMARFPPQMSPFGSPHLGEPAPNFTQENPEQSKDQSIFPLVLLLLLLNFFKEGNDKCHANYTISTECSFSPQTLEANPKEKKKKEEQEKKVSSLLKKNFI